MTINPVVLHQGRTVKEALDTFEGTKLRVLPVIDDSEHVVGVVNLEDMGYLDVRRRSMSLSETIMHKPLIVGKQTSLEQAAQLMMERQQDHIFVVDEAEKLVGVVSGIDVVKKII